LYRRRNGTRREARVRSVRGRAAWVLAAAALLSAATWPRRTEACADVGCIFQGAGPLLLIAPVVVAAGVADLYYVPLALGSAIANEPPGPNRARSEVLWTSWQAGLLLTSIPLYASADETRSSAMPALAFATWPLALTADGVSYWPGASPALRDGLVGTLGAADAVLLGYDVVGLVRRAPTGNVYLVLEVLTGGFQTLYGVSRAAHLRDPEQTRNALILSSLPAGLLAHSVTSLALGPRKKERRSRVERDMRRLGMVPFAVPREDGAELMFAGAW
jgi:hypothetical protein